MGNTAFKISTAVVLAAALPIAWQSHANSAIRAEVAEARRAAETVRLPTTAIFDATSLHAEVAALRESLAASRRKAEVVKASLAENQRTLDRMQQEVLVKFGKTEDLARTFAAKLDVIIPVLSVLERKEPFDAAAMQKVEQASKVFMELLPYLGQLRKMDEEPEQAGRFVSTLLAEVMKLSPETTSVLERTVVAGYSDLKRDGLTLSGRPNENHEQWTQRRNAADKALTARVLAIFPENARNHPILKFVGGEAGILLPAEAGVLGNISGGGGPDGFLKASPREGKATDPRKQP